VLARVGANLRATNTVSSWWIFFNTEPRSPRVWQRKRIEPYFYRYRCHYFCAEDRIGIDIMETTTTTTNHPRGTQLWRGSSGGTTDVIEGKLPEEGDNRNLTAGAIADISALRASQHNTDSFQPIVQVLRSTKHEYCYELVISDGSASTTVYLDRPCEEDFYENCLLRLVRFKNLPRLHEDSKYV
jgi:hypothetical protein